MKTYFICQNILKVDFEIVLIISMKYSIELCKMLQKYAGNHEIYLFFNNEDKSIKSSFYTRNGNTPYFSENLDEYKINSIIRFRT